jgi:hypothetical protein
VKLVEKIKEVQEVVATLIGLALEIATLLSVVKYFIIDMLLK